MSHARKQIRDAFAAAVTGLPTTGARVYIGRVHPLADGHEPSLLIYTGPESVEAHAMGRPRPLLRTLTLHAHAVVSATDGVEDALDQIAAEVEAAIGADETLGGLALATLHTGSLPERDGEGRLIAGSRRLDFEVQYRTTDADPQTIV